MNFIKKLFLASMVLVGLACSHDNSSGQNQNPPITSDELKGYWLVTEYSKSGSIHKGDESGNINFSNDRYVYNGRLLFEVTGSEIKVSILVFEGPALDLDTIKYSFSKNEIKLESDRYSSEPGIITREGTGFRITTQYDSDVAPNEYTVIKRLTLSQYQELKTKPIRIKGPENFKYEIKASDKDRDLKETKKTSLESVSNSRIKCEVSEENRLHVSFGTDSIGDPSLNINADNLLQGEKLPIRDDLENPSIDFKVSDQLGDEKVEISSAPNARCTLQYTFISGYLDGYFYCQDISGQLKNELRHFEIKGYFGCNIP